MRLLGAQIKFCYHAHVESFLGDREDTSPRQGQSEWTIFVGGLCNWTTGNRFTTVQVLDNIISRNRGPEVGIAIGLLFYVANTVAAAVYLTGAAELIWVCLVDE